MKEKPILFSTPMVQAILDGRKTMTRRVVRPQPNYLEEIDLFKSRLVLQNKNCPYKTGMKLWVRETFNGNKEVGIAYKASNPELNGAPWKPSIFMPRWASRITLEITNIRVDKLVTLDYNDAIKEGFESVEQFKYLWDKINSKKENCLWQDNPWVWILEFRRV